MRLTGSSLPTACVGLFLSIAGLTAPASARDVEPRLTLPATAVAGKTVALTLDACSGAADRRILDALVADRVPATIFVTHRWLKRNADAIALLKANADLFEIENHGDQHVPAITDQPTVFHLKTAGSLDGVRQEIVGGAAAIVASFGSQPRWYRGAGARYSPDAVDEIRRLGYRLAGYSLNADSGASLPAARVERNVAAAKPGDVIIAHVNQPTRSAGAGLVAGIRKLEARGFSFVRLEADPAEGKPQG